MGEKPRLGPDEINRRVEDRRGDVMLDKIEEYIKKGLTEHEASDLVTLENTEYQGGQLVDTEKERKRKYMEKMADDEKEK